MACLADLAHTIKVGWDSSLFLRYLTPDDAVLQSLDQNASFLMHCLELLGRHWYEGLGEFRVNEGVLELLPAVRGILIIRGWLLIGLYD